MDAIIFMFCITLHNIEEALWLTDWLMIYIPDKRGKPSKDGFIFSVMGITLLGYLTAGLHALYPENLWFEDAFIGFAGAMVINVVLPHLLLTIRYKSCCPGVFTGCFLIAPLHTIFILNALNERLTITEVIASIVIVGLILLISIPMFQALAKLYLKREAPPPGIAMENDR